MQLRFTSFVVINLRRDLHPQECAHAGRTSKKIPSVRYRVFFITRSLVLISWPEQPAPLLLRAQVQQPVELQQPEALAVESALA